MEYGILIGAQMHLLILAYEATRSKSTFSRYKVRKLLIKFLLADLSMRNV